MSDKYRIDSHKLIYHPERVTAWRAGENVYPLYIEVSPTGQCNHRCVFCGLDFMGYQNRRLDTAMLETRLTEMGRLGVKSIMYAGEGEPFLHPDMCEIVAATTTAGIDASLTTNAVLMNEERARAVLPHCAWIKVSINAGTPETYAKIHSCKPGDFERVIGNMTRAAELKAENGWRCTLGMQLILLPENRDEVVSLARKACEIGMDYLVVKPYSQHTQSHTTAYRDIRYEQDLALADELAELNTNTFSAIFRLETMKKWDEAGRPYKRCLALPFWSYIDAGGGVWGCSIYLEDERFLYGNITEETFESIWTGEKRRASLEWVRNELDVCDCRVNCRMDAINRYLWELQHPPAHVNFI